MSRHKTILMLERADGSGNYRVASATEIARLFSRRAIRLEGADGDEESNTVTYWYARGSEAARC